MPEHDPHKFAHELAAKLATRSRHVCAFLGAGVGCASGLADVAQVISVPELPRFIFVDKFIDRGLDQSW